MQARSKFQDEKNMEFDYSMFHESVVRLFFDLLHGIERIDIPLVIALEFAILLGYDGQLKQNSDMEMELFESAMDQFRETKMSKIENALVYLYVQTWGLQGEHVLEQSGIWKFKPKDLQMAIMSTAYPGTNEKTELIKTLKDLILGRFENGSTGFYEWSLKVHKEASENTVRSDQEDPLEANSKGWDASLSKSIRKSTEQLIVAFRASCITQVGWSTERWTDGNVFQWRNVDYNIGNHFKREYFIVPVTGIYSFYVSIQPQAPTSNREIRLERSSGWGSLAVANGIDVGRIPNADNTRNNNQRRGHGRSRERDQGRGREQEGGFRNQGIGWGGDDNGYMRTDCVTLQATVKLTKNDNVKVSLSNGFSELNDPSRTYFEGRLIAETSS